MSTQLRAPRSAHPSLCSGRSRWRLRASSQEQQEDEGTAAGASQLGIGAASRGGRRGCHLPPLDVSAAARPASGAGELPGEGPEPCGGVSSTAPPAAVTTKTVSRRGRMSAGGTDREFRRTELEARDRARPMLPQHSDVVWSLSRGRWGGGRGLAVLGAARVPKLGAGPARPAGTPSPDPCPRRLPLAAGGIR